MVSPLVLAFTGPSYARVELFQHRNCGGWKHTSNLDRTCYHYPNLENDISGVRLPIGSCAKIYKSGRSCQGTPFIIKYPNSNYCTLPCCGWNDQIKSVRDCSTRERTVTCLSGTYVREIYRRDPNHGATIVCYQPTSTQPTSTHNTHGISIPNPISARCPIAAFGLNAAWSNGWRMFHTITPRCQRGTVLTSNKSTNSSSDIVKNVQVPDVSTTKTWNSSKDHEEVKIFQYQCSSEYPALSGLKVLLDEADVIKDFWYICRQVPNPAEMCEPMKALNTVVSCDIRQSGNALDCTYSVTTGVGLSSTLTETERREYQWSGELGLTIGGNIYGLSTSMSAKLGYSQLVGYQWSRSDTTTWKQEVTASATIRVRPYTWSVLEQLTGKCTFYGVQVNYFRQVDKDQNGKSTVTYFSM